MIDHIAAYVDFPEIDVRQRLAVSKGYGVTEMSIPTGSPLTGRSIKEAMTVEMDINVLTLYRGTRAIPNPRLDRTLEAEDRLLCFGKLDSMRTMVPKGSRRRRNRPYASSHRKPQPNGRAASDEKRLSRLR